MAEKTPGEKEIGEFSHASHGSSKCSTHNIKLDYWCSDCQTTLCSECLLDCHRNNDHQVTGLSKFIILEKMKMLHTGDELNKKLTDSKALLQLLNLECIFTLVKLSEMGDQVQKLSDNLNDALKSVDEQGDINIIQSNRNIIDKLNGNIKTLNKNISIQCEKNKLKNQENNLVSNKEEDILESGMEVKFSNTNCDKLLKSFTTLPLSQWPLDLSVQFEDGRTSKLSVDDNHLYIYCLNNDQKETNNSYFITIQISVLESFATNLGSGGAKVFLDLSVDGSAIGRVTIQLWGHLNRAKQFLSLCLGTQGYSYKGASFGGVFQKGEAGEAIFCGEYYSKDSVWCTNALLQGLEWDDEYRKDRRAGLVVAADNGKTDIGAYFAICTKEDLGNTFGCAFGEVVSGMDIVEKAVCHEPVTEVIIENLGMVIPKIY